MKKRFVGFLLLFLVGGIIYGKDSLYVGTDATEFPPFEYIENGKITGFDIELMEEIGKVLNREVIFKNIQFDGLIPALQTGKLDVVIAGMTVTEEREKNVAFSTPYYTSKQLLIVNNDSAIEDIHSLDGSSVGVVLGCTGDIIATEMKDKINLYRYNTTSEAIMALNANRIDVVILDSEPAKNFAKSNSNLKLIDGELAQEDYAIAVKKDDKALIEEIDKALITLKKNGIFEKLSNKYFIQN